MQTPRSFITFAICGVLVPIAMLAVDHISPHGWWPDWVNYVWPTDYMLGATSAIVNRFWFEIAALSIALNAIIYGIAGAIVVSAQRKFFRTTET
jgi:ABC-type multidrug transport system permease subunit